MVKEERTSLRTKREIEEGCEEKGKGKDQSQERSNV